MSTLTWYMAWGWIIYKHSAKGKSSGERNAKPPNVIGKQFKIKNTLYLFQVNKLQINE